MRTPATRNQVLAQQQRKDELRRQLDILDNKTDELKISTNLQAKKVAERMITTDSHILRQHLQNHNTNPKAASVQACAHAYFSEPDTRFFLKNPKKKPSGLHCTPLLSTGSASTLPSSSLILSRKRSSFKLKKKESFQS